MLEHLYGETGIPRALELLLRGGVIAFPTDTVYGIAAHPAHREAVARLFEAKQRPAEKAIPILLADVADLARVAQEVPEAAERLAAAFWPGALTIVMRRRPEVPGELPTVGVRIPNLDLARELIRRAGGMLAVTSANISGGPNTTTAGEVIAQLDGRIDAVLDDGPCPGGVESSVVDVTATPPRVLRHGGLSMNQLCEAVPEII